MTDRELIQQIAGDVTEMKADFHDLKEVVYGNGEPAKGLAFRVAVTERRWEVVKWVVVTIVSTALVWGVSVGLGKLSHARAATTEQRN